MTKMEDDLTEQLNGTAQPQLVLLVEFFWLKKIWVGNFVGSKKMWVGNFVWSKKFKLDIFWGPKKCGSEIV